MKSKIKLLLLFLAFIIVILNIAFIFSDNKIKKIKFDSIYNSCNKTWSSRGVYLNSLEQNSLSSVSKAFKNGFEGVEIDFYYDIKMDKFIVSHNKPKKNKNGELQYTLKNGKFLTLEELFTIDVKARFFWLDYKNLDRINSEDTNKAIKRLEKISKKYSLKERLYIEGSNPFILQKYTNAGFKTILAFKPLPKNNILSSLSVNVTKLIFSIFNISALAMPYGKLDNPVYHESMNKKLDGIPVFLFHTPDNKELINHLSKQQDVRVILVGRDKSINRSYLRNCN